MTIAPAPSEPLAILAKSQISLSTGLDLIVVDLNPPWSPLKFTFTNDSNDTVTIVAMSFEISDPITGGTKDVTVVNFTITQSVILSTIRANGDLNCDGYVDDDDATVSSPIPPGDTANCSLDATNLNYSSRALYIEDFSSSNTDGGGEESGSIADQYRGQSFPVIGRFEGWYGPPEQPLRNFYQEVVFNLRAN